MQMLVRPRNFKGGIGSLFDPCVNAMGRGHIDRHLWRRVIVPSYLAPSFGVICAHYCYRVIHRAITYIICVHDLRPLGKDNSPSTNFFGGLNYKKIRRYNNSPPYVTAKWWPQQIPPFNFLELDRDIIFLQL